jgi:toxin FitB
VSFLLDTCFVSELSKRHRSPGVIAWLAEQSEEDLFLSAVTIGELEKGLAKLRDTVRARRVRSFVETEVVDRFRERTLATDEAAWRRWGKMCGEAERVGKPMPVLDALIAAVAQVHGLTVVTRNEGQFIRCGVPVVNPWLG